MVSTSTTRLGAVNTCLSVVGSAPVSDLTGTLNADTSLALSILDETDREVQCKGWNWNTEEDLTLEPNAVGNTKTDVSALNAFRIDIKPENARSKNIIIRDKFLYDVKNRTYEVGTVTVDIVYARTWEELPEAARRYIAIRTARVFHDRVLGSQEHHAYTKGDEMDAWAGLQREEMQGGDYSMIGSGLARQAVTRRSPLYSTRF